MMKKNKAGYPFVPLLNTVLFLTLFSAGTSLWLSSQDELSPKQDRILDVSVMTWQMGSFTLFGLLGGKATRMIGPESDKE